MGNKKDDPTKKQKSKRTRSRQARTDAGSTDLAHPKATKGSVTCISGFRDRLGSEELLEIGILVDRLNGMLADYAVSKALGGQPERGDVSRLTLGVISAAAKIAAIASRQERRRRAARRAALAASSAVPKLQLIKGGHSE